MAPVPRVSGRIRGWGKLGVSSELHERAGRADTHPLPLPGQAELAVGVCDRGSVENHPVAAQSLLGSVRIGRHLSWKRM